MSDSNTQPDPADVQQAQNKLKQRLDGIQDQIGNIAASIDAPSQLDFLVTGGKKPDFDTLSDEQLRQVFDQTMFNVDFNKLPGDYDAKGKKTTPAPYSTDSLVLNGAQSSEMSRSELIEGLEAMSSSNGNNIRSSAIANIKTNTLLAQSAEISAAVTNSTLDFNGMVEKGTAVKGDALDQQITNLKSQIPALTIRIELKVEQLNQPEAKPSVRDMLRGAADRVSNVANTIKTAITDKVDQIKLERLEKQLTKRENHLQNLVQMKQDLNNLAPRAQRDQELKDLQAQYNPTEHIKGDPAQVKIDEKINELKELNKLEDRTDRTKLDERITKNQTKVTELDGKKNAQADKIAIRAAQKDKALNQEQTTGIKMA